MDARFGCIFTQGSRFDERAPSRMKGVLDCRGHHCPGEVHIILLYPICSRSDLLTE